MHLEEGIEVVRLDDESVSVVTEYRRTCPGGISSNCPDAQAVPWDGPLAAKFATPWKKQPPVK